MHPLTLTGPDMEIECGLEITQRRTPGIIEILIRLFDAVGCWRDRAQSRRQLLSMDDRMLSDIGVDRATARAEGEKPFWIE